MSKAFRLLVCLIACSACQAAEWYPGIVHFHTTFSDGSLEPRAIPKLAAEHGWKFVIVTDHYDNIGEKLKPGTPLSWSLGRLKEGAHGPWGFEQYAKEVRALTQPGEFVAIPGAEIRAYWNPEPENQAQAHILALGPIASEDEVLAKLDDATGCQQAILDRVSTLGMLSIAAHPSLLLRSAKPMRIDYRFDMRPADQMPDGQVQYRGLNGIGMWNGNADHVQSDLDFYMRLIREGAQPFVTADSDYHGITAEREALGRVTWVYSDELTEDGILSAIRAGRTYAAQHGAQLIEMSPMAGENVEADRVTIRATVQFPKPAGSPKDFMVYRDGLLVEESRQTKAKGAETYTYEWTDAQARTGDHSYVMRVGEVLLTSPTFVAVTGTTPVSGTALKRALLQAYEHWTERRRTLPFVGPRDQKARFPAPEARKWQEDVNGDGEPEAVWMSQFSGGSGSSLNVAIVHPRLGTLFEGDFTDGSVLLVDVYPESPGDEVVIWTDVYQSDEAHIDPHQQQLDIWRWSRSEKRYVIAEVFRTRRKYGGVGGGNGLEGTLSEFTVWRERRSAIVPPQAESWMGVDDPPPADLRALPRGQICFVRDGNVWTIGWPYTEGATQLTTDGVPGEQGWSYYTPYWLASDEILVFKVRDRQSGASRTGLLNVTSKRVRWIADLDGAWWVAPGRNKDTVTYLRYDIGQPVQEDGDFRYRTLLGTYRCDTGHPTEHVISEEWAGNASPSWTPIRLRWSPDGSVLLLPLFASEINALVELWHAPFSGGAREGTRVELEELLGRENVEGLLDLLTPTDTYGFVSYICASTLDWSSDRSTFYMGDVATGALYSYSRRDGFDVICAASTQFGSGGESIPDLQLLPDQRHILYEFNRDSDFRVNSDIWIVDVQTKQRMRVLSRAAMPHFVALGAPGEPRTRQQPSALEGTDFGAPPKPRSVSAAVRQGAMRWDESVLREGEFRGVAVSKDAVYATTRREVLATDSSGKERQALPIGTRRFAVGANGLLYVAAKFRVEVWHPEGRLIRSMGSRGKGPGKFGLVDALVDVDEYDEYGEGWPGPQYLALGPRDTVYAYDEASKQLKLFSSDGKSLGAWLSRKLEGIWVRGLAVDKAGNVYVSDGEQFCVRKLSSKGQQVAVFGSKGSEPGKFLYDATEGVGPGEIALDSLGNVYVVDNYGQEVEVFDPTGRPIGQIRSRPPSWISDVACGPDNSVYTVDGIDGALRRFSPVAQP